jgi:DNA-binding beta-propeller fold protein YncE
MSIDRRRLHEGEKKLSNYLFTSIICFFILLLFFSTPLIAKDNDKVVICHYPPGNEYNAQSIIVPEKAVDKHLAHGDDIGHCDEFLCSDELWVIDNDNDQILKIDQTDGSILNQLPAPGGTNVSHHGLAWDGEYIWVNQINNNTLYKCDLSGTVVQTYIFPQIHLNGLVFANDFLWASGRYIVSDYKIFKINPADGSWTSFPSPVNAPQGIGYGGGSKLWIVGNTDKDEIYTYDFLTAETVYQFDSPDTCPSGLAYQNGQLLILGCYGLHTIDPNSGATISSIPLPNIGYGSGITFVCR